MYAVWCGPVHRSLHGVDIDHAAREIYMPLSDPSAGAPEALLLVDYDNSNVGEYQFVLAAAACHFVVVIKMPAGAKGRASIAAG